MFGRLRLWAGLVAGDQQQGGVHDGGAVQHRRHQYIVTGTVDEADVTNQPETAWTRRPTAWKAVVLAGAIRHEARRPRALLVVAFVDLGVGITLQRETTTAQNMVNMGEDGRCRTMQDDGGNHSFV